MEDSEGKILRFCLVWFFLFVLFSFSSGVNDQFFCFNSRVISLQHLTLCANTDPLSFLLK